MSAQVRKALYNRMAVDGPLNALLGVAPANYAHAIYYEQGVENTGYPFVVFSKSSGVPTATFGHDGPNASLSPTALTHGSDALQTEVWLIKGVDHNSSADPVEAIAARIDTLFYDTPNFSLSAGTLVYLRRDSDVDYAEMSEGVQYRHCGALYRLVVSST